MKTKYRNRKRRMCPCSFYSSLEMSDLSGDECHFAPIPLLWCSGPDQGTRPDPGPGSQGSCTGTGPCPHQGLPLSTKEPSQASQESQGEDKETASWLLKFWIILIFSLRSVIMDHGVQTFYTFQTDFPVMLQI